MSKIMDHVKPRKREILSSFCTLRKQISLLQQHNSNDAVSQQKTAILHIQSTGCNQHKVTFNINILSHSDQ